MSGLNSLLDLNDLLGNLLDYFGTYLSRSQSTYHPNGVVALCDLRKLRNKIHGDIVQFPFRWQCRPLYWATNIASSCLDMLGINLHKLVLLVQELNTAQDITNKVMEFESAQSNTTAKLPILKLGEYEMRVIRIKQYFQMSVPVTAEEKTNKKNDVKARSLLLMALPNENQLTFSQYTDAKTMFAAIETRF
ncbi:hypothetical protein Tco_0289770 [Tanacetum coccineum]